MIFFDLCNTLEIFQAYINDIFSEFLDDFCIIYLDDILIYSKSISAYTGHVQKIW